MKVRSWPRLGVNIDHVATLRQARGEHYPSVKEAAGICLAAGADQITIHLREDRRHIQDHDVTEVRAVTREWGRPLNLEMGCASDIVRLAIRERPDWVCLVPEKREEKTTEGGLNLLDQDQYSRIGRTCEELKKGHPSLKISLFVEAREDVLEKAAKLPIDALEIHTGDYARTFLTDPSRIKDFWEPFELCHKFLEKLSLGCHAGHGLTQESVLPLLQRGHFEEYNIGHWIICEALFKGLSQVVGQLKGSFNANR